MKYLHLLLLTCFFFLSEISNSSAQSCSIIGDDDVCLLEEIDYYVTHSLIGTGITYQWYILGGGSFRTLPPTSETVTVQWNQPGIWILICEVYQEGVLMQACMESITVSSVSFINISVSGNPLYQSAGIQTFCLGSQITIDAVYREGEEPEETITVDWTTEGSDAVITSENFSLHVTFVQAGPVNICVIITDQIGCQKEVCFAFNIISIDNLSFEPNPNVFGSNPVKVCNGQEVYFKNTSEMVNVLNFEWEVSDGSNIWFFRSRDLRFTFTQELEYTVTLKPFTGLIECEFEPYAITVNVAAESIVPILCPMPVCTGDEICYIAGVSCESYEWNITGEGSIQSTNNDEVCVVWENLPGNTLGALVLNSLDCTGNICTEPTVEYIALFPPSAQITGDRWDDIICGSPTSARYRLPDWGGVIYQWSLDILESTSGTASLFNENSNPITISLNNFAGRLQLNIIATQNIGECEYISSKEIIVYNQKISTSRFCYGDDATISLTPSTNDPIDWILSDQNGVIVYEEMMGGSTLIIPSSSLTLPGTYTTMAMLPGGNPGNCMLENTITILPPITNPFISGPMIVCLDEPYMYSVPAVSNFNVEWQIEEGGQIVTPSSTQSMLQHTWTHSTGPYIIRAKYVRSNPNCSSEFTELEIHIKEPGNIIIMGNETPCPDNNIPEPYMATFQGGGSFNWTINPPYLGSIVEGQGTPKCSIRWHFVEMPTDVTISVSTLGCKGNTLTNELIVTLTPVTLSIDGPSETCAYEDVSFSTEVIGDYTWYHGEDIIGHTQALVYSFVEPGMQVITLLVSNAEGCNGIFSATHVIEVLPNPRPPIFLSGLLPCPEPAEFPEDVFLITVDHNDPNVTYIWRDPANNQIGGNEPFVKIGSTGLHSLEVIINGCSNTSFYIVKFECDGSCDCEPEVDVKILGYELIGPDCGEFVIRGRIEIFGHPKITSRYWRRQDPKTGEIIIDYINAVGDLTRFYNYSQPGIFLVELVVEWQCPSGVICPKDYKKLVTIPVVSDFDWTYNCIGDGSTYEVILNDKSTSIDPLLANEWSGDVTIQSGQSISFTGEAGISYEICLTQETVDNYICVKCQTVTLPGKPEPNLQIDMEAFCEQTEVEITPGNINLSEVKQVEWDFGDGSFSRILNPVKVYSEVGSYNFIMNLETIYGCEIVFEDEVTVHENKIEGEIYIETSICQAHSDLSFTPTSGGSIVGWNWSTGETSPSITVTQGGLYSITVDDEYGCSYSTMDNVDIFPIFPLGILGNREVCQNINLSVENPQGANVEWNVYQSNNLVDTETGNVYQSNSLLPGEYQIIVQGLSGNTLCDEIETYVTVYGFPDEPILSTDIVNCIPLQVSIESDVIVNWSGPGISNYISDGLVVSQPGVYSATVRNSFGCEAISTIEVEEGLDFSPLATGCGMICKDEFEPGEICLEGIPGEDFDYWAWKINGNLIPGAAGTGEIVCLEIIEAYFDRVITLYVEDGDCIAESEEFYIQGTTNCIECPDGLIVNASTPELMPVFGDVDCDEYVYFVKGTYLIPQGYIFCDYIPVFEGGYIIYDEFNYPLDPTYTTVNFSGHLYITDMALFMSNPGLIGQFLICDASTGALCPAKVTIQYRAPMYGLMCNFTNCIDSICGPCNYTLNQNVPLKSCMTFQFPTCYDDCEYNYYVVSVSQPGIGVIYTETVWRNGNDISLEYCLEYSVRFSSTSCWYYLKAVSNCGDSCESSFCINNLNPCYYYYPQLQQDIKPTVLLQNELEVFPNPNNGDLIYLKAGNVTSGSAYVIIYSIEGSISMREDVGFHGQNGSLQTDKLTQGTYVISVQDKVTGIRYVTKYVHMD